MRSDKVCPSCGSRKLAACIPGWSYPCLLGAILLALRTSFHPELDYAPLAWTGCIVLAFLGIPFLWRPRRFRCSDCKAISEGSKIVQAGKSATQRQSLDTAATTGSSTRESWSGRDCFGALLLALGFAFHLCSHGGKHAYHFWDSLAVAFFIAAIFIITWGRQSGRA